MHKLYVFAAILMTSFSVSAQDTIISQDLPSAGDIFNLSIGTSFTGMDVTATGINYNWDFSNLGRTSQRVDSIVNPINTDTLLSYFFINISLNTNRSNQASRGQNFALGLAGFSEVYNYYYNSNPNYKQVGFGAVVNGVPIPIPYTPHDILYNFPLKYEDADTIAFGYELDLTSTVGLYYNVKRNRISEVDGWGTLLTPYGSFEVLRVKSQITETDSIYVDSLHLGLNVPVPKVIEYKWLSPGLGLPVLQINTNANNTVTQILYQDSVHLVGIPEIHPIENDVVVFPNPVNDKVIVRFTLSKSSDVLYELYSIEGKRICSIKEYSPAGEIIKAIDLKDYLLSSGNYLLKIKAGDSEFTKQLTKE